MSSSEQNEASDNDADSGLEYEAETITINLKNNEMSLKILSVVPPPLEYMLTLHSNQQEISGRKLWAGSLRLGHYILQNQNLVHSKSVLELGCGTGFLGMAVSRLGSAMCVAMTDGDEEALCLLKRNYELNCVSPSMAKATKLLWGNNARSSNEFFKCWCRESWPDLWKTSEDVSFDVILAGDVLYKEDLPSLFFETVILLMSKSGCLLLCHVPRSTVTHEIVRLACQEAGFHIETLPLHPILLPNDIPIEDIQNSIIYRITKNLVCSCDEE